MSTKRGVSPDLVTLRRLCAACVDLLGATGAGVSLLTAAGGGGPVGVTDDLAAHVEEWQFSLGEGPCRESYASNQPVIVPDLGDGNRHVALWPMFADAAQEAGIQAIFSFPFSVGARPIGVLDIFRDRAGLLSNQQIAVAKALANLAATLLQCDAFDDWSGGEEPGYRFEVHQATGMIAAQLGISTSEALARLRARAFAQGRTDTELAVDVVHRSIRFAEDDL